MIGIRLPGGHVALIDDLDSWLLFFSWHARRRYNGDGFYAARGLKSPTGDGASYLHREVMGLGSLRDSAGVEVDHINGNGLDCRRSNLRLASRTENMRNMKLPKHNTSGFKGVSWLPSGRWRAAIRSNRKTMHLGVFENIEEAAHAYDSAARELFGEFARLNFPDGAGR